MTSQLSENDKQIVQYLRRSPDSLKQEAADLIEKMDEKMCLLISSLPRTVLSDDDIGEIWIANIQIDLPGTLNHEIWLSSSDVIAFARAIIEKVTK